MPENSLPNQNLSNGANQIVQAALNKQQAAGHPVLGANHWLLAYLERNATLLEAMSLDFSAVGARKAVAVDLAAGRTGGSMDAEVVVAQAIERARGRGKAQAGERDLAAVILVGAGYHLADANRAGNKIAAQTPVENMQPVTLKSEAQVPDQTTQPDLPPLLTGASSAVDMPTIPVLVQNSRPQLSRHITATPALDQYGRDLTKAALENKLSPIIGRDEEIQLTIETLCRRTKRNPVLVGPAGVGKTAIAEGMAQQIAGNAVPDLLKNSRLIALQPSILVAGASVSGELEKRMKAIIQEASQDGIILFIDEIHSAIGAGGMVGTNDIASILKPALARGDLACIAATTDDEYRRFIEPDTALERRFQPIRIQELAPQATLQILKSLRDSLLQKQGVRVSDPILSWLVDFGQQYMRNRHFPDKAVDLLEQCMAHAISLGKSSVELDDAKEVAQRMIGMPIGLEERLHSLQKTLLDRALLAEDDIRALVNRLQVTLRGLDLRPTRPNAVILLAGKAAENSEGLAEAIAQALFGSADRVIGIGLSRFNHPEDLNLLVGAPPGYVGYSESLPIHRLMQIPWSVLRFESIDSCHPSVKEVIIRALADGFITDGRGKAIYLSDAIVLLTAQIAQERQHRLGFAPIETAIHTNLFQAAENLLGLELVSQVDVIANEIAGSDDARRRWIEKHLLIDLSERYLKQGLKLEWETSAVDWLMSQRSLQVNEREWERFVDGHLSPAIIPFIPETGKERLLHLAVKYSGTKIAVDPLALDE